MSALLQTINFNHLTNWSVAHLLESQFNYNQAYELVKIGDFLTRNRNRITIDDNTEYKRVTIRMNNNGIALRDRVMGKDIGTKKQFLIEKGQFLLSKIDARNGAFGLATDEVDGAIITADFFAYEIDKTKIEPYFLVLMTTTKQFQKFAQGASSGTTGRQRIDEKKFLDVKIPLPSLNKQKEIVEDYQSKIALANRQEQEAKEKEKEIEGYLYRELGVTKTQKENSQLLEVVNFKELSSWSYRDIFGSFKIKSSKYEIVKLNKIILNISTGTTPPSNKKEYFAGNINFYTPSDIGEEIYLTNSHRYISQLAIKDKKARVFFKNTLLFVGIGSTTGKVGILKNEFATSNQQITGICIDSNFAVVDYVYYFLNLFKKYYLKDSLTSTIPIFNQDKIKNINIILPSKDMQKNIVEHLNNLTINIKKLKKQSQENKILALQEFEKEIFNEA